MNLRVCQKSKIAHNCCKCEKCLRTICGIFAEGYDPNDFGFKWQPKQFNDVKKLLRRKIIGPAQIGCWYEIKERFIENKDNLPDIKELRWLYTINLATVNDNFYKKFKRIRQKF